MSEKLCDLFGRLVCVSVCVRCFCCCCFLFTRAALFIMAKLLFLLFYWCALESSWRGVKPGWGPGSLLDAVNTTAMHIHEPADGSTYIYMAWVYIFMRILYVHLLFYSVCSRFVQQSVDTINYQLYFHFIFLSLISAPARANLPPPLPLPCDSWSTGRRPQSASN